MRGSLEGDPTRPRVTWGIHTHNDAELAVANSIAAVAAGVRHVQATINGYGERCGNANMVVDPRQPRAQDRPHRCCPPAAASWPA